MVSFEGRLERLPYFLRSLALWLAGALGGFAVAAAFAIMLRQQERTGLALVGLGVLPLVGALMWCSLSLHVRRIRDIGWDPWIVVAGWILVNVADKLVLPHLLPGLTHGRGTLVGTLFNLVLTLVILLWPGREGEPIGDDASALYRAPRPARHPSRAGGPPQFGRRGMR